MLPCDGCDNALPGAPQAPALVRFYATPPLRIYLVDMPYTPAPGQPPVTTPQAEIDEIVSFLRRTYPAAALQISSGEPPHISRAARDLPSGVDSVGVLGAGSGSA